MDRDHPRIGDERLDHPKTGRFGEYRSSDACGEPDELLAVECRVGAGVEHEVVGVSGQPDRADAIVRVEVGEFDDAEQGGP